METKSVICSVCNTSCLNNAKLRRHYRLKHPNLEQPVCKKKGKQSKLPAKPALQNSSKCSKCQKAFVNVRAVKIHEAMAHVGDDGNTVLLYFLNVDGKNYRFVTLKVYKKLLLNSAINLHLQAL